MANIFKIKTISKQKLIQKEILLEARILGKMAQIFRTQPEADRSQGQF